MNTYEIAQNKINKILGVTKTDSKNTFKQNDMNNNIETKIASFNLFELEVPVYMVDGTPQSGSCDNAIAEWLEDDFITDQLNSIGNDKLSKELYDYGAWSDEELEDFEANKARILWIAIVNIWEWGE